MWRDPMHELIDDLEQILPAQRTRAWGERPPLEEIQYWTDRVLAAGKLYMDSTGEIQCSETGMSALEADPGFQDHMRRWEEWRMRMDREAAETSRRRKRGE